MQLQITPGNTSVTVSPAGQGPIVTLFMGPGSEPSPIGSAPIVESPEDSDNVLINRAGQLEQIPYAGVISAAAAGAAAAAVAAVESELATITTEIADVTATANAALPKAGGTMTGALVLAADPASAMQAVTKEYSDAGLATEAGARIAGDTTNASAAADAQATANAALPKAGGTMTGALVLAADPAAAMQAVTKEYSDAGLATEAGARIAGDATNASAAAAAQATANAALPKAGGTMTGALTLAADPASALQAVTKEYSDAGLATEAGARVSGDAANASAIAALAAAALLTTALSTATITPAGMTPFVDVTLETLNAAVGTRISLQWFENRNTASLTAISGTASTASSIAHYAQIGGGGPGGTLVIQSTAGCCISGTNVPSGCTPNPAFIVQQAMNWVAAKNTLAIQAGSGATYTLDIGAAGEYLMNTQLVLPPTGNLFVIQDKNAHFKFSTSGTKGNAAISDGGSTSLPRPSNFRWEGGTFGKVGNHYYTDPATGIGYLNGDPTQLTLTPSPISAWVAGQNVGAGWLRSSNGLNYVYNAPGTTGSTAPTGVGDVAFGTGIVDGTATCSFAGRPSSGGYLAAPLYIGTGTTPGTSNAPTYSGDIWYFWLDNFVSIDQTVQGFCNPGQAWKIGGDGLYFLRPSIWCCNGTSGAGGFHFRFGSGVCIGGRGVSGDDLWQDVMDTGPYTAGTGFGGSGNLPTKGMVFIGCGGASLQGRLLTQGLNVGVASPINATLQTAQSGASATMTFAPAALHASGDLSGLTVGASISASALGGPLNGYFPGAPNFAYVLSITGNNSAGWTVVANMPGSAAMPAGASVNFINGTPPGSLTAPARCQASHCVGYSAGGYGLEIHQNDGQAPAAYAYDHVQVDCSGQGFQVACAGQGSASSTIPFGTASNAWWISQASTVPVTATLYVWAWDYEGNNYFTGSSGQTFVSSIVTSGGNTSIVVSDNNGPFVPSAAIPAGTPFFFSLNSNSSAGVHVVGGCFGGAEADYTKIEVFGAFRSSIQTSGNVRRLSIDGGRFYKPLTPGMPATLAGILSGEMRGCPEFWGTGTPGDQVLVIGGTNGSYGFGTPVRGASSNFAIGNHQLINAANGTYAEMLEYCTATTVHGAKIIPADATGAQSASGIQITNTCSNCDADFNDCSRLAGQGVTAATGNTIGWNNEAGTNPIAPVPSASFDAAVQAAVVAGLPTSLPSTSGTLWNDGGQLAVS